LELNPSDGNAYSCIQFSITVDGTASTTFTSYYQATLLGSALFSEQDYTKRQNGEYLQVGPAGPLNNSGAPLYYGSIKYLSGSGDLVPNPYYDTSNYVWGLSGAINKISIGPKGQITHTYNGEWYLGYMDENDITAIGNDYDYLNPLLTGQFALNWTYTSGSVAQVNGYVTFPDTADTGVLPYGWGYPLLYQRIPTHQVVTSDVGFLMIKGSLPFCSTGICKSPPPPDAAKGGSGLASDKLGIAIGVPLAVVFVVILFVAAALYWRRRRETEKEDGIFAVARKPEYGSALVVDDIIEETRGSRTLQAMIDIKDEYDGPYSGDDSDSGSERGRSRSRTPNAASRSVSRSRSRSGSRSSRARSVNGDESDPGASASRDSDSE